MLNYSEMPLSIASGQVKPQSGKLCAHRIGLVGIGGVGEVHTKVLQMLGDASTAKLCAVADPVLSSDLEKVEAFNQEGVLAYVSLEEMRLASLNLDAIVIATPIPLHYDMTMCCLREGLPVLLEKPPVILPSELEKLIEQGGLVSVGFQLMVADVVKQAKRILVSGELGPIKSIRTMACWPRTDHYYNRAAWAGKMHWHGLPTFDGPATNGLAHLIHLGMYFASGEDSQYSVPETVQAELYRARPIESYDGASLRCRFGNGIEFTAALVHCAAEFVPGEFEVICAKGTLKFSCTSEGLQPINLTINSPSGRKVINGSNESYFFDLHREFINTLDAKGTKPSTTLTDCRGYVQTTTGALVSSAGIHTIPADQINKVTINGGTTYAVRGIEDLVKAAYADGKLFSELGVSWSQKTNPINLASIKNTDIIGYFMS